MDNEAPTPAAQVPEDHVVPGQTPTADGVSATAESETVAAGTGTAEYETAGHGIDPPPVDDPSDTQGRLTPPRFSTSALVFGAVIFGLGLAGVIAGTSPLDWNQSSPIGFIGAGLIAAVGLGFRWRRVAAYTRAAEPD